MIQHKETGVDEISIKDILGFLKVSGGNIIKSTLICMLAGGAYYFTKPKMYEASATIEIATVFGIPVEDPVVLLEKIKLPLYFSSATLQACGTDGGINSHSGFINKIKPSVNKSAPLLSFVTQAQSTQQAIACLNVVIAEVASYQAAKVKPLIEQKKQKILQLTEQLKLAEEVAKTFSNLKVNYDISNEQHSTRILSMIFRGANLAEINDLRSQISNLEGALIYPQTRAISLVSPVYASELPVNKRPLFTVVFCLILGVFWGLLITWMLRVMPSILRQIR